MTTVKSCECDECIFNKNGNCDLDSISINDMGCCWSVRKKGESK